MKFFLKKIGVVSWFFVLIGCQEVPRHFGGNKVLAEAAGEKLYLRDVNKVVPRGMTGEDSVAFLNRYIDKWINRQLKLREAEQLFSDSEQDIDSLVEEYRQALLIRKLDSRLIEQNLDTLVSSEQIAAYHKSHAADFKVNQTLVKGRIVRFGANNRQASRLRSLMTAVTPSQQKDFTDICTKNHFEVNDFTSKWVTFSEFLSYLPILRSQNYDALLASDGVQEMKDGRSGYYFQITAVLHPGEPEPLERVEQTVRRILLTQRQNDIVREYETKIYEKALEEGDINVYNEEKE